MFNARNTRNTLLVATVAALAAGCDKAPEYDGEGPKMEFVRIPAGSFYMGSPDSEQGRDNSEGPVHEVRITKPFYVGKYEVTQAQWEAVMGTTLHQQRAKADSPWLLKGEGPEHPMYYVSWEEASEFCKRLGRKFRLPTEAEWEYACRAGSRTRFYYGDDPNYVELDQYAWYSCNSDNKTQPVGQKKPNAWGLYDIHGNVGEWCLDLDNVLNEYERIVDSSGRETCRVFRGGSWLEDSRWCRSAARVGGMESVRGDFLGFRVVYTGRTGDGKEVLEISLPEKPAPVATISDKRSESRPQAIAGVVRDEAGLPIGHVDMWIIPHQGWDLREYAKGSFEITWRPSDPNTHKEGYHFMARHRERNLAVGVEIEEDANELKIKLKPGVILTGQVVDGDGKGIEGATVVINNLQRSGWSRRCYLSWVEADAEGRFEIRSLPPEYDYGLSARNVGYRPGHADVRSEDVRDDRVEGISIELPSGQFSVSGVVVDVNGEPMVDVEVFCFGENQPRTDAETGADGRFTLDGVFKGQVTVQARGYELYGFAGAEAGATNIRIVLDKKWPPPGKGRACFPVHTDVWVDGELMQISEVAEGQIVGKRDWSTPTTSFGRVEEFQEHVGAFECRDIVLENGSHISVMGAHCFMLDSGQWIPAQDLRSGLRLKTLTGTARIESVTTRPTLYIGKVCNLKIKGSDRYPVGKDDVIVRDY